MSLKVKIDVFPLESYMLQDPSVVSVMQAVVLGGGVAPNKRRDGNVGANPSADRRLKTPLEKLMTLKARCREEQCVHSVEGVLLVHLRDHPHVLLLRHAPRSGKTDASFYLPGGRLRKGEAAERGLLRKLGRRLLNEAPSTKTDGEETSDTIVEVGASHNAGGASFRIGEALGRWYRPHFDPFMYPYIPAHVPERDITEVRSLFLVHLPPQMIFTMIHPDVQIVVVPLFDLHENATKYGPIIASIPTLLSRVNINICK